MNKEIYNINSSVRTEIQGELLRIAEDNNIRILYACESGSRAWGFASPESDYDIRFIFLHPTSWYLSVLPQDDGMDLFIDKELDINGWDIRKVLRLMMKSNITAYEWLQSPIVYQTDEDFKAAISSLSQHFFQARSSIQQYLSLAGNAFRRISEESEINVQKYLYVMRPLLAAMWIAQYKSAAPMTFAELLPLLKPFSNIEAIVLKLWEKALLPNEKNIIKPIQELNDFIQKEIIKCNNIADAMEESAVRTDMLDAFFRMVIQTYNGDY
jgi:predicted nucleotidyltransferase